MNVTEKKALDFLQSLQESEFVVSLRNDLFERMKTAKEPFSRYGLSIDVSPQFDVNSLVPEKISGTITKQVTDTSKKAEILVSKMSEIPKDILSQFFGSSWDDEQSLDSLSFFNLAFANDLVFIRIPKGVTINEPISIEYILDSLQSTLISNIFIYAEANSSVKILYSRRGTISKERYVAENIRIIAEAGSFVEFVSLQSLSKRVSNVQSRVALVKQDAVVSWNELCMGSLYTKNTVYSNLIEKGARSMMMILYAGSKKQVFDIYTLVDHNKEHTTSSIVTRGVLSDTAKALSRGLIFIAQDAPFANGYEKQDALLLSSDAEADAIPQLEINNHDVQCGHGSTIGQVDKDVLFYLMARGLSESEAKKLIVEGYFAPVLEQFNNDELKEQIVTEMQKQITV